MMKIFLLEHNPFILLYFINMFFLFIYRKLDGFETLANTYYFIFISSFLLLSGSPIRSQPLISEASAAMAVTQGPSDLPPIRKKSLLLLARFA